ncbi:LOW QUALITY PROTEIN: hypothetical protein M8C21_031027, partial [Ambrosia artemisiifolia]
MRWNRIAESSEDLPAHTSLFCFTLLLVLKLHHLLSYSWRSVFIPLFVFHLLPEEGLQHLNNQYPMAFMGWGNLGKYVNQVAPNRVPWLIAFELLLLAYLSGAYVSLAIVFLPLLAFEVAIFVDNFRMCKALLQEPDDAIWLALPILLCMRLEGYPSRFANVLLLPPLGKPAAARYIPLPVVFSPIFLVQGLGVFFGTIDLVEKFGITLPTGIGTRIYFAFATRARDSFGFFLRGYRRLGRWSTEVLRRCSTKVLRRWSTEEASRDDQAPKYHDGSSGQLITILYNTFSSDPPEIVKTFPEKDLTEE